MTEIYEKMTLRKANVEKIETIEDNGKRVEAVGNLTKPRMKAMLVMQGKNYRVKTSKKKFWLDFIVTLNLSGVVMNGVVVGE